MKLNLGCGFDKRDGYINLDNFEHCNPDILHDIESAPYPFPDDYFDEILIKHVLEHVGQTFSVFKKVIQEIYRISRDGAKIIIQVPNYKHVTFWSDPTHVRAFDEITFSMMSRKQNDEWIKSKSNYTMLSYILNVDFEITNTKYIAEKNAIAKLNIQSDKELSDTIVELNTNQWNIIKEFWFELKAIKPPS